MSTDNEQKSVIRTDQIGERLELVQRHRLKAVEDIAKIDGWYKDEGLSISMLGALKDIEKQELAKHKIIADKEEGDANRDVARQAIGIISELRKRRQEIIATDQSEMADIPDPDNNRLPEQGDQVALMEKNYQPREWNEFRLECIKKGLDPKHRWDETTQAVVAIAGVETTSG